MFKIFFSSSFSAFWLISPIGKYLEWVLCARSSCGSSQSLPWTLNSICIKLTLLPKFAYSTIASFVWFRLSGVGSKCIITVYNHQPMSYPCSFQYNTDHKWRRRRRRRCRKTTVLNETWHSRQLTSVYFSTILLLFERKHRLPADDLRHEN